MLTPLPGATPMKPGSAVSEAPLADPMLGRSRVSGLGGGWGTRLIYV